MVEQPNEKSNALVSVIMPAYNCEDFIDDSILSVLNQTYKNVELLVVDDQSTDGTAEHIQQFAQQDPRVKFIQLAKNSGAAVARNTAIEQAEGRYLAFLDSDDLWEPKKLEKQIAFMEQNSYAFTCTPYDKVDEHGNRMGQVVPTKKAMGYEGVLKDCPGNSTIVYNAEELGKFYSPDIKRRNDFVMWLQVIKKAGTIYGMDEVLTYYRVREGSLSVDKKKLLKYQWQVYRDIEKLSLVKSSYLVVYKVLQTLKSRGKGSKEKERN